MVPQLGSSTNNEGDVRFGSKADMCNAKSHVRFTPESGHWRCTNQRLLSANSGQDNELNAFRFRGHRLHEASPTTEN